jgi:nucleotide-binding universal stress UspA family protein
MPSSEKQTDSAAAMNHGVLLAVYDEQLGREQCDFVTRHPWPLGTTIHLLFVVELSVLPILAPGLVADIESEEKKYGQFLCESLTKRLMRQLPGCVVMTHIVDGDARDEILKIAAQERPELIVLGSRPHHGLDRIIASSVSNEIAQHAQCSTYIVRIPEAQAAETIDVANEDLPVQITSFIGR